jgi:uncharacterized protein YegP (UPF0339 family)
MGHSIKLVQTEKGLYSWDLYSGNNRVVGTGTIATKSQRDALRSARSARKSTSKVVLEKVPDDTTWRWRMVARNGGTLAVSHTEFTRHYVARRCAQSVAKFANVHVQDSGKAG